jgi:hypothetical protein
MQEEFGTLMHDTNIVTLEALPSKKNIFKFGRIHKQLFDLKVSLTQNQRAFFSKSS